MRIVRAFKLHCRPRLSVVA